MTIFSNDIDWELICQQLDTINWNELLLDHPPDAQLDIIMKKFYDICKANVPLRKSANRTGKPKIPRERRILMRKRKKVSDQLKLQLSEARRKKLQRKLVDIEVSLQKSHQTDKVIADNKAIQAIKNNSKYFFTYAKKHSTLTCKVEPLLDENNMYRGS